MVVRIAIAGTGSIGTRHLRVFASLPEVEVVAIPQRRPERARQLRAEGYCVAASLAAALPCDGLVIASDTGQHVEDVRQALALGLRTILVEKPLAPSWDAAQSFWPDLVRSGCRLFVGCCLRFHPGLLAFRERLAALGAVHAVAIECRSYLPDWRPERDYRQSYSARRDEGGVLRDLFHEIDYALWLFGVPQAAFGHLGHSGRLGIQADDHASLFWTAPCGAHVSIGLDYLTRSPVRRLTAHGVHGSLAWDMVGQTVCLDRAGEGREILTWTIGRDNIYEAQARAFVAAIRGQPSGILATALESCSGLALCDALRRSHQTGKMEAVRYRAAA